MEWSGLWASLSLICPGVSCIRLTFRPSPAPTCCGHNLRLWFPFNLFLVNATRSSQGKGIIKVDSHEQMEDIVDMLDTKEPLIFQVGGCAVSPRILRLFPRGPPLLQSAFFLTQWTSTDHSFCLQLSVGPHRDLGFHAFLVRSVVHCRSSSRPARAVIFVSSSLEAVLLPP